MIHALLTVVLCICSILTGFVGAVGLAAAVLPDKAFSAGNRVSVGLTGVAFLGIAYFLWAVAW